MITADIQAAFVQIQLPEEDKDLTRFLWVKNRKTRRSVKCILSKLYVDNVILEADEPETTFQKDFISNYKEFNDKIPEYDKAKGGELKEYTRNNKKLDHLIQSLPEHYGSLWMPRLKHTVAVHIYHMDYQTFKLVSGKLKVTPIKRNVTISRLDLIALLLGLRLAHSVITSLKKEIIQIYIVGSNKAALSRLISSRSLPVFMGNQVKRIMNIREELLKLTKSVTFHYTPSELNPSDTGTRGCRGSKLSSSLWVNSPAWRSSDSNSWPITSLKRVTLNFKNAIYYNN
uniref:Reverse transcriptase domain-containing protein n=1 Tax=Heterorhabditis bacteriophora TaxID=37862 RepID=A0A1I7W7R8_HETBA